MAATQRLMLFFSLNRSVRQQDLELADERGSHSQQMVDGALGHLRSPDGIHLHDGLSKGS